MAGQPPIRVAVVIPDYGLVGGAEELVFALTERLARRPPWEIHVLANRWRTGGGRVRFHRVPILPFPRWLKPVSFAWCARRILAAQAFDIVHTHERIFSADLFSFHGIPHRVWVRDARKKRMSLFDRATARVERQTIIGPSRPLVLPVSSLARDALLEVYPQAAGRIRVLAPGVDTERFAAAADTRRRVRGRYGFTERDTVMLFVGMNFRIKRLELAVRALARLGERTAGGGRPGCWWSARGAAPNTAGWRKACRWPTA